MASRLEMVPRDILQHVAFLCASSPVFEPPVQLLRLLQTSSVIYRSLNVPATPDLYAQLYCTKFDIQPLFRRYRKRMTDSALAAELLSRLQLLRRSYRLDSSPDHLAQDLWTALWMLLENDSLNEQQFSAVDFSGFILHLARLKLRETVTQPVNVDMQTLKHIIVWLLCLTLSRRQILDMSKENRDELYSLIFPYIFLFPNHTSEPLRSGISSCPAPDILFDEGGPASCASRSNSRMQVYTYLRKQEFWVPDPSTAAINLASVILEVTPVKVPYHLPETRAVAIASQRSGPTREDYNVLVSYQTSLAADSNIFVAHVHLNTRDATQPGRSLQHDVGFGDILRNLDGVRGSDLFRYIPGTMTGLWEGIYRTVDMPNTEPSSSTLVNPLLSMVIIKPMQCVLREYISDCQYCPVVPGAGILNNDVFSPDFSSGNDDSELLIRGRPYRKYAPKTGRVQRNCEPLKPFHDVILLGETPTSHDQAWGGFKFSGQVHSDGHVLLKRESKDSSGDRGLWIFEGSLRSGTVILGRWRMAGDPNAVDHGIFSLGKRLNK